VLRRLIYRRLAYFIKLEFAVFLSWRTLQYIIELPGENKMIIEWLRFQLPPEKLEQFILRDEEVWTAGLRSFPGFLGKEILVDPVQNEVVMLIRWETKELWKSVPQSTINELDAQMGEFQMPIAESREYQVGKFLH
jgi:uncharacterized protein (TIGR03792 family)